MHQTVESRVPLYGAMAVLCLTGTLLLLGGCSSSRKEQGSAALKPATDAASHLVQELSSEASRDEAAGNGRATSGSASEEMSPAGTQKSGTAAMVRRLEDMAVKAGTPENYYASGAWVRKLQSEPPAADLLGQMKHDLQLARQLLQNGQTEKSLELYSRLEKQLIRLNNPATQKTLHVLKLLLALGHLRLGAQQNCVSGLGTASCLFPVSPAGIHRQPAGSRAAFNEYLSALEENPGDLTSRWLLNIAAMNLGDSLQEVPSEWRIPASVFDSDYQMGRFRDVAPALGVDVVGLSGGAVMEDLDGDGFLDIMATSWGQLDQMRLFRNNGDGSFTDRTDAAGLIGLVAGLNMVHGDYDNDGHPDILVLRGAWLGSLGRQPNSLLRNLGDGTFKDVTQAAGLLDFHPTQTAAWGDYDNDGWLDLYVGNETAGGEQHPCQLFHNDGDGTFTETTVAAGVAASGIVKAVIWGDVDNDGLQDLFLSRFLGKNTLYHNNGKNSSGQWTFTDISQRAGVQEPINSLSAWFWDYDNDGWLDLFVPGYGPTGPGGSVADVAADYLGLTTRASRAHLYHNNGNGTFTDRARAAHVDKVLFAMGANFGDLDNDGFPDFYVGTGEPDLRAWMPNRMFRNQAGRLFQDVTTSAGVGHLLKGHAVALGDIDNDGDLDLYEVVGGAYPGDVAPNVLFVNPGMGHHHATFLLEGIEANRSAMGARLKLTVNGPSGRREIYSTVGTGGSFGSSSLRRQMGLGEATSIDSIEVLWPGTAGSQKWAGVPMDRVYRIRQGSTTLEHVELKAFRLPL